MSGWKRIEEPSLDDLLADDLMVQVMESAGTDRAALRRALAEMASRIDVSIHARVPEHCAAA
jgi:hypothetical protein